jgi:hypothetical protein
MIIMTFRTFRTLKKLGFFLSPNPVSHKRLEIKETGLLS